MDSIVSRFFGPPAALLARSETVVRYLLSLAPCRRAKLLLIQCSPSSRPGSESDLCAGLHVHRRAASEDWLAAPAI